jgi:signal transduction histidine kinase
MEQIDLKTLMRSLRLPVTNILGFSELIASPFVGYLNAKQQEYLSDVQASAKTLLATLDDLDAFFGLEAGD